MTLTKKFSPLIRIRPFVRQMFYEYERGKEPKEPTFDHFSEMYLGYLKCHLRPVSLHFLSLSLFF